MLSLSSISLSVPSLFLGRSHKNCKYPSLSLSRVASIATTATARRASSRGSLAVVMMAKREEELKGIRAKTTDEINEEIVDLKGELFMLRYKKSATQEEVNPCDYRLMRKKIARMLTVKREREVEEGIGKRLSRKLDRQWKRSIVIRPPPSVRKLQEEAATAAKAEK